MNEGLTVRRKVHFKITQRGRKRIGNGERRDAPARGNVPRMARLVALAIRCNQLIRDGVVSDQAELARLGHVTRARLTQIMNLVNLAPDIQEEILFLRLAEHRREPICERQLRQIAAELDRRKQRGMWKRLNRV